MFSHGERYAEKGTTIEVYLSFDCAAASHRQRAREKMLWLTHKQLLINTGSQ